MDYTELRRNIQSGDLLAWSHRGIKSWHDFKIAVVRAFTRSEYSHVGIAWVVGGRVLVIEAVKPHIRIFPVSHLGDFYYIPLNAPWRVKTEEKALSFIGQAYSELGAIKGFLGANMEDKVHQCAALVLEVMESDGIDLGGRATPDAVVLAAQKLGKPTYYISNPKKR